MAQQQEIYVILKKRKPIARFGLLNTQQGEYEMPALSPSLTAEKDSEALKRNIRRGLQTPVITPKVSCRKKIIPPIQDLLFPKEKAIIKIRKPFVLPDPESEAFSVACNARKRFMEDAPPQSIMPLFSSGLTSDTRAGRKTSIKAWEEISNKLGVLKDFMESKYTAVGSDAFLAPMPIIRNDRGDIKTSFDFGKTILDDAMTPPVFTFNGIHLLIHEEVMRDGNDSDEARREVLTQINGLLSGTNSPRKGAIISLKFYDSGGLFTREKGSIYRQNISDFIQSTAKAAREHDGMVVVHNMGHWGIGALDSGADVATFNSSGWMMWIDTILRFNPKNAGKRPTPPYFDVGTLVEEDSKNAIKDYKKTGGFALPASVEPQEYWKLSWSEQKIYSTRTRIGALVELSQEYHKAGLSDESDGGATFQEAIMNRIRSSKISSELYDMCPSVSNSQIQEGQ